MRKSYRERSPLVVGACCVLALATAVAGALAVGTFDVFEESYPVSGLFESAAGLEPGDEVHMAGVEIGAVTAVRPDFDSGDVQVEWKVLDGHDVSADARAEIGLLTLTGEKYLRIDSPGGAPHLADLPREERVIGRSHTDVPADLSKVLDTASRQLVDIDAAGLDGVLEDVTAVLDGKGETLEAMLRNVEAVAGTLNDRDVELTRLITAFDDVSASLAAKDETLVRLVETSEQVLRVLAERRDELARTLGEGTDAVVELTRVIEANRTEIDAILDDVHRATGAVARQQDDLDRGLTSASIGLARLGTIGDSGPWVDTIVRLVPDNFLATIAQAYPEFGQFLQTYQPISDQEGGG